MYFYLLSTGYSNNIIVNSRLAKYREFHIHNGHQQMGAAGASITALSAEDLGAEVGKLGKAYESVKQDIVDNGISGDVLFGCVKDDEAEFKSFVSENLRVNNKLHQTVLYKNYIKLLSSDGDEGGNSASVGFDIRDTIQRSPKDILSELFQIQGIPLDPDNVAAAVDKIAAAVRASVGDHTGCDGETSFDCFISYRVAADKDIAEKIYYQLLVKGIYPFLDKVKLKDGMDWKEGFLQGLKGSKCFISLISRKALEPCRDKTKNHTWDNVLLEIETALRYKNDTGNGGFIIPVLVGEWLAIDGVGRVLKKFDDFAGSLYADIIEGTPTIQAQNDDISAQLTALLAIAAKKAQEEADQERHAQQIIDSKRCSKGHKLVRMNKGQLSNDFAYPQCNKCHKGQLHGQDWYLACRVKDCYCDLCKDCAAR